MPAIFDTSPCEPCPQKFNLAEYVLSRADELSEKVALSILSCENPENWTYAELKAAVLGTANGLLEAGLKPGDTLMLRLGNTVDFPIAYLAAIAVGIHPIPLSSQLTMDELQKLCLEVSPSAACIDPDLGFPQSGNVIQILLSDLKSIRNLSPAKFQIGACDHLAYLVFTSGTSGAPKVVMHAHRAIWARRMMFRDWYDLRQDDRLFHAGAFNWTYTLGTGLLDPWTLGATALIVGGEASPEKIPSFLAKHGATIFAASPGVYRKLVRLCDFPKLPKLRHGLSAGEKLSDNLGILWRKKTSTEIYEAFGMSECSTFISSSPKSEAKMGTLGRPQKGRRVAILPQSLGEKPLEFDETGIIAVDQTDPGLMLGYLGARNSSDNNFRGSWFLTGDLGQMACDGSITYLGRNDDVITAGGYRISPIEIEAYLQSHPKIQMVAVKDIEIKEDTRIITAFYTADATIDDSTLKKFAAEKLARYKQPRLFVYCDSLPVGLNGKLLRKNLTLAKG